MYRVQLNTAAQALSVDARMTIVSQMCPSVSVRSILDCTSNGHTSNTYLKEQPVKTRSSHAKKYQDPVLLLFLFTVRPPAYA